MKNRVLYSLIIREIFPPFILAFSAISAFMLLGRMMVLLQPLLMAGITAVELLRFIAIILPSFFGFSIPIAVLLGNLLAFMRLSRDSEIMALICCGVNFRQILAPVVAVTCVLWLAALAVSIIVVPLSKTASKNFLREVTERILARGIPQRVFFNPVPGLTFYVDHSSDEGKKFQGVFISDERKSGLTNDILARRGRLAPDETGRKAMLILNDGVMSVIDMKNHAMDCLHFGKYVLRMQLPGDQGRRRRGEMGLDELYRMAYSDNIPPEDRISYRIEFQKRFAIPFGVLIMGLIAVPLGCLFGRTGLSGGIAIGLAAFLSYYMILELAANIAHKDVIPPEAAMWIPNIMAAAAVVFLMRKLYAMEGGRR